MSKHLVLAHAFESISVRYHDESRQVLLVELNRPGKRNAMNWNFWRDYAKVPANSLTMNLI